MTGYAILFEDNVNCSDQRDKYMNDHLKFLEANSINIKSAGPLIEPETNTPAGGLWLVEASDEKAARAWSRPILSGLQVCANPYVFCTDVRFSAMGRAKFKGLDHKH